MKYLFLLVFVASLSAQTTVYGTGGSPVGISGTAIHGNGGTTINGTGGTSVVGSISFATAPVAYWQLCGSPTGTTSATTTVPDDSGKGSPGVWNGTPSGSSNWYSVGSQCVLDGHFDGSTNYITVANTSPIQLTATDATVLAWVNFTNLTPAYTGLVTKFESVATYIQIFVKSNGKLAIFLRKDSVPCVYDGTGSNTVTTGGWHLIGFSYKYTAGTLTGYVDGVVDATQACGANYNLLNTGVLNIGRDSNTAGRLVTGLIGPVRVWNSVLTAAQIRALYLGNN